MTARRFLDRPRGGYVLVAVLWTTVAVSACALGAAIVGREATAAASNRVALTRAAWRAEACVARVLAIADATVHDGSGGAIPLLARATALVPGSAAAWRTLDRRVLAGGLAPVPNGGTHGTVGAGPGDAAFESSTPGSGCDVRVVSAGTSVDVNTADAPTLRTVFTAVGMPPAHADSVVAAILFRRDSATGGRPFAAAGELEQVPGLDSAALAAAAPAVDPAWRTMVGVDSAPIDLLHAPEPVLASVPGLTAEAIAVLHDASVSGRDIVDMLDLAAHLTPAARTALLAPGPLGRVRVTFDPDVWIVTARVSSGTRAVPPTPGAIVSVVTAVLEIRIAHAGKRVAVVRRRTWVE